jgi:hypothetical protein
MTLTNFRLKAAQCGDGSDADALLCEVSASCRAILRGLDSQATAHVDAHNRNA